MSAKTKPPETPTAAPVLEATTEAPPAPLTDRVLAVLQLLARGRGALRLREHTLHLGAGWEMHLGADPEKLPEALLEDLLQDLEIRTRWTTAREDGAPLSMSAAVVLWRPQTEFNAASGFRHRVTAAAQERIRGALVGFLRPSHLVDAGPEVWACWPFTEPLAVDRDPELAAQLLEALAARLGGDAAIAQDLRSTLPLCGIIRNFGARDPLPRIEIVAVSPETRYTITELRSALGMEEA